MGLVSEALKTLRARNDSDKRPRQKPERSGSGLWENRREPPQEKETRNDEERDDQE
jgi:hypothetical protein